jgi:hypothetical protein
MKQRKYELLRLKYLYSNFAYGRPTAQHLVHRSPYSNHPRARKRLNLKDIYILMEIINRK